VGSMNGRVALVTGATGGLAKAVAAGLAREGADVVVVGRTPARAEEAAQDIRTRVPGAKVESLACDLSLQSSVHSAVAEFLSTHGKLDVLVNAAAVFRKERHVTPDGLELTFATNVMSYFLLSTLLQDALKSTAATAGSTRIVNVASPYGNTKLNFDDLQTAKGKYSYLRSTPPTMLARVLLTQELAERLRGTGVVANAVHPGLVKNTGLLQDVGGPFRWITNKFGSTAEKAADTPLWLATAAETGSATGKLWNHRKELPTPGMGSDPEARRRLWAECARLAGMG
jgi:retinol dehydrogenase-12